MIIFCFCQATSIADMKTSITRFATEKPLRVYTLFVVLALAATFMIPRIHIDTDPENMLPAEQADRVFHNQVEQRFVLHDAIVVGAVNDTDPNGIYNVRSLSALHALSNAILALEGVIAPDAMTLAQADNITQAGYGAIRFEWLMREAPTTQAQAGDIRAAVERLPLLRDTLVSGDGRAAAIYVPIKSKDLSYKIAQQIKALSAGLDSDDVYHITGLPVAEDTFGHQMFVQMGISAPLAGLMIFLLMWYFFRSVTLIIAPMIVAMITVIVTMGALIGLGFTVHIMSSMIPIFLMPIAVVDSVHIMSEFSDLYREDADPKAVIKEVIDDLFTPMLFTSVTSAVGFASLLLTPIPPVQVFGAFVAFGILLAFVVTIVFIPAYISRMNPKRLQSLKHVQSSAPPQTPLARGLRQAGRFALRRRGAVIAVAAAVLILSILGMAKIQINDNPVRWFKASHPIRIADDALNKHFAGTYDAFLVLERQHDAPAERAFRQQASKLIAGLPPGAARSELETLLAQPMLDFNTLNSTLDDLLFDAEGSTADALQTLLDASETRQAETRYFQQPAALAFIEDLQKVLQDSSYVGKTNTLADVVKVVNRELRGGKATDYRIPEKATGVAQTLLQYQSSHRPQDLWHMVTPDFRASALWIQLKSGDNQDMSRVVDVVDKYLADNPPPAGVSVRWAGKSYINVVWQRAMVEGMMKSLLGAFVMVFIMMVVLFRSLAFGAIAMLPLSLTIALVYGLVGWVGKYYDMPIAVLSSLTLGLSVDFAIHFVQRLRTLQRAYGSFDRAIAEMFEEPGRAISRNAIVIALGFTPLFLAPLVPYITVGAFMALIMSISALVTLILLPAVISALQARLFKAEAAALQPVTSKAGG